MTSPAFGDYQLEIYLAGLVIWSPPRSSLPGRPRGRHDRGDDGLDQVRARLGVGPE